MDKSIYSPRSLQLAAVLQGLRVEKGMTLEAAASKIGRYHSYVKDYEDGQRRLDVIQLMEVARALGSSLTAIAEFLTQNPPSGDGSVPDVLPEFAAVSEDLSRESLSAAERDIWYQAEWSRLCALLRAARKRRPSADDQPLREQDVASRLGVKQSFVSKYETKKRRLDLVELEQIAIALDTTLLQLVADFESDARPYGLVEG